MAVKVTLALTRDGFALDATTVEVAAGFTTSESAAEVLPAKLRSPEYEAVIECEPRAKFDTEIWVTSLERLPVPRELVPSKNVTVPVARVPLTEGTTVAVRMTGCPNDAGLELTPTATEELAGFIVSVNAPEVLAA